MILRIFAFIFFYSTLVFATEVDNLSHRDQISDSTEWLNKKMNNVLLKSGVTTKGCSLADLHKNLYNQIGGGLYAKIELWSEENPNVYKLPINESIYQKVSDRYVSHFGILPVKLGKFYTTGNLKIGDFIIGDDKLGHFAAVGYSIYYSVKKKQGSNLPDAQGLAEKYGDLRFGVKSFVEASKLRGDELALDLNRFLEEGQWGLSGPGVKSFGDITANWEGYKFWSELTEGENPYFHCENNQFILSRKFNWMNYVSAAWDEGINCSERLPEIEFSVQNVIKEKRLSGCPIKQEFCKALVDRYQSISSKLLHPVCLKGKGNK